MISLDYTFMTETAVAGGIPDAMLSSAGESFAAAHAAVMRRWKSGELGFLDLPDDERQLRHCHDLAEWTTDRGVRDVVVLGIGGSALGPIALRTALLGAGWNGISAANRDGKPRLHVFDNVDPATMKGLLDRLELVILERTTIVDLLGDMPEDLSVRFLGTWLLERSMVIDGIEQDLLVRIRQFRCLIGVRKSQ